MFRPIEKRLGEVVSILNDYPQARNSDKILYNEYIKRFHRSKLSIGLFGYYLKLENLTKIPKEADIQRTRAYIQNTLGQYTPTDPQVFKFRAERQKDFI